MKPREILDALYDAYMNDDMCCRSRLVSEVEDLVDRLEELESKEFKWHLMADEKPKEGKGRYILMGHRGALYYADRYDVGSGGSDFHVQNNRWGWSGGSNFHVPNNRWGYMGAESVKAWAEIPPLEEAE